MNYDLDMPPYIQEMADWLDERQGASLLFERLEGVRDPAGDGRRWPREAGGVAVDRGWHQWW